MTIMPASQFDCHDTSSTILFSTRTHHSFAKKCIRHELVRVLNVAPENIKKKKYILIVTKIFQIMSNCILLKVIKCLVILEICMYVTQINGIILYSVLT